MHLKRITKELLAIFLLIFSAISFEWSKNLIYSQNHVQVIIHIGLLCLAVGLGIAGKLDWIEEIIAIVIEVVIYWAITWTNLAVSTWICTRVAPVVAFIVAIWLIIENLKNDNDSDD